MTQLFALLFVLTWRVIVVIRAWNRPVVDGVEPADLPTDGTTHAYDDLQHAQGLVTAALGSIADARRLSRWALVGFVDEQRVWRALLGASGEALLADQAAQQAGNKLDLVFQAVEPPAHVDPMSALRARRALVPWLALAASPRVIRALWGWWTLRQQVAHLEWTLHTLELQLHEAMASHAPAPVVRKSLAARAPLPAAA